MNSFQIHEVHGIIMKTEFQAVETIHHNMNISQHDPSQHDPSQHDPSQHDPSQQDTSQHDPSQHEYIKT